MKDSSKTKTQLINEMIEMRKQIAKLEKSESERKQAEEALRESEEHYHTLFNLSPSGIIVTDNKGTILMANNSFCKYNGYTPDELKGNNIKILVPDDKHSNMNLHIHKILSGKILKHEVINITKDRKYRNVELYETKISLPDGKIGILSISNDITERKQAEKMLLESEKKYRTLFEGSEDTIYISTFEGRFVDINPAGVELFGYSSKEELLKVDIAKDLYLNPYDRKKFIQTVEQQGFVKDCELLVKRRDGEILTLLSSAIPYRDKKGNITEYRGILRDVTHQRKLEQQLLHAQKMEAVGQLAGGVAHDFNNILTTIIGYASLLKMKMREDDPLRRNVDQILASSEKAANSTQSLLIFSRKQIISLQPVRVNEIVKKTEKLLLRLIGEDIELRTFLVSEDLTVMADSNQIEHVFMNLATNARDAMPDGGLLSMETERIEIDKEYIKAHGYGKPGTYALISVTDTGAGMDKKIKERIFDPFFTTKEVGKGTGLGLAMVYGIVKQHNGYINVYSELGKGTTFKIYLPLTKAEVKERKPEVLSPPIGGTETILLAEDDANVRTFTKSVLEEFGYTVIDAVDGDDAVNKFTENKDKVQLLILDVIMPKKSGKEAYEDIRKIKPDVKVLFISGYTANVIHKKGILEEGLEFILKPASPTKLLKKIRGLLEGK